MTVQAHEVETLANAVNAEVAAAAPKPHEIAKRKVEETVHKLCRLIQRDKQKIFALLRAERDKLVEECRNGTRPRHSFLPMIQEVFARRIFDGWTEDEQAGIQVFEGYCFVSRHQWFVVSGDPDEVQEPYWDYIVDPLPSGLLVYTADGATNADIVITPPLSLWGKNYSGAPEEMMRLAEQREQDVASKLA